MAQYPSLFRTTVLPSSTNAYREGARLLLITECYQNGNMQKATFAQIHID